MRAYSGLRRGVDDSSADVGQKLIRIGLQDTPKGDPARVGEGVKDQTATVPGRNQLGLPTTPFISLAWEQQQ